MKNPAAKTRKPDQPYATWTDLRSGWKYKLLKSWQGDNSKEYARWFVDVHGFGHDMGDEYVANLRGGIYSNGQQTTDLWFDETVWESEGSFLAWVWGER